MPRRALYVGLMSGTSLDGVDAVVAQVGPRRTRVLAHVHHPFPASLREALLALCASGTDEIERAAQAGNALADLYALATREALATAGIEAAAVRAIGCHGQTIRHRPERGYTVQIGNAARLAERTGMTVVADFRSRDVAAGGQGAPLVPAFHRAMFASADEDRAVLNVGGIANVTLLPRDGKVLGFDTGPGNCLLDAWIEAAHGVSFDAQGAWAAGAVPDAALLDRLIADPYFRRMPPKSTGREHFNVTWLEAQLDRRLDPRVVQATLLELTAHSIADAVLEHLPSAARLIVCGGGARNDALVARLVARFAPRRVESSERHGIGVQQVEAAAFAWLARCAIEGKPGNLPQATGATGARVLGAIYPG